MRDRFRFRLLVKLSQLMGDALTFLGNPRPAVTPLAAGRVFEGKELPR